MASKGTRKDPAWKYGEEHEVPEEGGKKGYKYIKCNFCSKVIKGGGGGVKRVKEHLACTHKDVVPCPKVPDEVKAEMIQYLKAFQNSKFSAQRNFEENVGSGAYYSSGCGSVNPSQINTDSYQTGSSRGFRGPMDRKLKQKFLKKTELKEDDEWIADPIDDEEDDIHEIDEALGGGDDTREEDGGATGSRGGRATGSRGGRATGSRGGRRAIGEESGSVSSRKRKSVQVALIDEDDDFEVNSDREDDDEDDMLMRVYTLCVDLKLSKTFGVFL
ncbi:hypothetical protein L2E82_30764 [Cichorium intybus]|uniref:Uncharacterized protein n=1 Tax=Cichorium intybus TaxID=13427 RepID=A0ACB9D1R7_CICIN|nr:hypothetical protein L2E82_30764 [Cichorium intybus]